MTEYCKILLNTNGRLERFRDLFTWMVEHKLASINRSYLVVESRLSITPKTEEQNLFRVIQHTLQRAGYTLVLYEIKL